MNKANINRQLNCAIYTRKSTDEGLDKEFNSLDAQRECAEAYIKSQTQEGWQKYIFLQQVPVWEWCPGKRRYFCANFVKPKPGSRYKQPGFTSF